TPLRHRRSRAPPSRSSRPNAVHGSSGRLPRVVRGTGAEGRLVRDDTRIAADLLRPCRMPEQVGIVALLPDQDQVRRRHELGHEVAPCGRAGKGSSRYAVPAGMVRSAWLAPELLLFAELLGVEQQAPGLELRFAHAVRLNAPGSDPAA